MKIFRLTTNYPNYLRKFYLENGDILEANYDAQYQHLMSDCFGWANFWTKAFRPLGYSVWEPVSNAEFQQKKWASENAIEFDETNWLLDISLKQICKFQPEILFINDYSTFSHDFIKRIREVVPNIKLVIGWCGAPYSNEKVFKAYDIVLTNLPYHYENFLKMGHSCYLMNHAFEPTILNQLSKSGNQDMFNFLGSIILGDGFHNERLKLIQFLVNNSNIKIYSDTNPDSQNSYVNAIMKKYLSKIVIKLTRNRFYDFGINTKDVTNFFGIPERYLNEFHPMEIVNRSAPGLFGLKMYEKLLNSLSTLNQHIDISKGSSNNMRLYEATGVGTCLVTDWTEDLGNKFEPDYEVVTYKNLNDLKEKIDYLSKNPEEAIRIGKRGQSRTLKDHNFGNRAVWLDEVIKAKLR